MKKQKRVVFSKNPAPTDEHVHYFYKAYLRFKRDIVKSIAGGRVEIDTPGMQLRERKDARVSFQKKRDGTFIPMLSVPLKLNPPELERIQIYEAFFPLYLKLRNLLIEDMHDKLGPGNFWIHERGPSIHHIQARLGAINLLCVLMYTKKLNLQKIKLIDMCAGFMEITSKDILTLSTLSEHVGYHSRLRWSFYRKDITCGDLFGKQQQSWWGYVKKFYPYKPDVGGVHGLTVSA